MEPSRAHKPYHPPATVTAVSLHELVGGARNLEFGQMRLLDPKAESAAPTVFCAGDLTLLHRPAVAVVGSREVSPRGMKRAQQMARTLARAGIVVVSGLAKGVDTAAHWAAVEEGGRTVAVIGTPLDRVTPVANAELQELIYRDHLLVSPFPVGAQVHRSNFPRRNRIMAALTDATVIIEAGDTSGTLHQAAECARLGRLLFIPKSLLTEHRVNWPRRFIDSNAATVFTSAEEVVEAVLSL